MKKFWLIFLTLAAVLCLCLGLAACGGSDENVEKGADGHVHTADRFESNNRVHWKICTVCGDKFSIKGHRFKKDNTCEVCGYELLYTEGLKYIINVETDSYTVTEIGEATDESEVVIPAYYKEKAVTKIGRWAFSERNSLVSVIIPDTVTFIGEGAFSGCSNLQSVSVGKGVTSIEDQAFDKCYNLKKVIISDLSAWCNIQYGYSQTAESSSIYSNNPLYYAGHLYLNDTEIKALTIPSDVEKINDYAFANGGFTSVTIPTNVVSVGGHAFGGCFLLESVTISNNVTSIGSYAFLGCSSLVSIQFRGTVDQWNLITKGSDWNYSTGNYTIVCTDGTIDKSGNVTRNSAAANVAAEVALCPPAAYIGKE